ncbi:MAG TPA: HPP family protein [Pseudomonadales bacterium]|jgi:CBS-domain-containing membrane protein|nr:HPP family protein [Pseudomonadales bacterium]HMU90886.1 HPP family protein [Pseudomonadales bacterium]HMW15581.1 HPP family protein [Pseudomonadales bacterium]HMW83679.1 HPP family protein [Pseudomonadales bacterium]HMY97601.1 HPP family protein [Pseudomonadales bacterium]
MRRRERFTAWLGIEAAAPLRERLLSSVGGFIGLLAVAVLGFFHPAAGDMPLLTGAMGATAMLLFALPHAVVSQPWPLFGGHLLSAIIGLGCARWLNHVPFTPALAVGLAIAAMHGARCLHPPGGATALIAAMNGPEVQALGWHYLLDPLLLHVGVLFLLAMLFNAPFAWRRYPARWARAALSQGVLREEETLSSEDIAHAVRELGLVVDVDEVELRHILALALQRASSQHLLPELIVRGCCYSNGAHGEAWSVRQVLEMFHDQRLRYRSLVGPGEQFEAECGVAEFADWARYEVRMASGRWRRVQRSGATDDPQA